MKFFAIFPSSPPKLDANWYSLGTILVVLLLYLTFKYYQNEDFKKTFKLIQLVQMIVLYSWYLSAGGPLKEALPFYHCRIAMFGFFLLPNRHRLKQFLMIMAPIGSFMALAFPVFDPFGFPHVTNFSYVIGHLALLVNSIAYLLTYYEKGNLTAKSVFLYNLSLNSFLAVVNMLLSANYGFIMDFPVIQSRQPFLNIFLVTVGLSSLMLLVDNLCLRLNGDSLGIFQNKL